MTKEEFDAILSKLEEASKLIDNAWSYSSICTTFSQRLPIIELQDNISNAINLFTKLNKP